MVKKRKSKYDSNNINDFTKKKIITVLTSNMYIFDYKIIMYWLPLLLYINFLLIFIIYFQIRSEILTSILASILIYILYFLTDIIYQVILCKNTSYFKLIKNSLKNSFYPALFVSIGYFLGMFLKDENKHILHSGIYSSPYKLYNIHINNIIISVFFYIFSIFYNNPLNKKKCINNKLC